MSISSTILSNITSFRNLNGPEQEWTRLTSNRELANPLKVVAAEVGYIVTVPFAIVEAAIAAIAIPKLIQKSASRQLSIPSPDLLLSQLGYKLFSACLTIGQENHDKMANWVQSSFFSIVWSLGDAAANPFCNDMIQTEKVARACAASGNIFSVPRDAL